MSSLMPAAPPAVTRTIKLGTGAQISQRGDTPISWGHILTASVQRLAF